MTVILTSFMIVVNLLLGFVGLLSVIYLAVGGYRIASSGDDTQAYQQGKDTIKHALIGTVFVLLAVPLGNLFISQVAARSGANVPDGLSILSSGRRDVPTVAHIDVNVDGNNTDRRSIMEVRFSEPVIVFKPGGVKIATNNIGALNLRSSNCSAYPPNFGAIVVGASYPAPGSNPPTIPFLCFTSSQPPDAATVATQFLFGRDSSIQDLDGNMAITAFQAVQLPK